MFAACGLPLAGDAVSPATCKRLWCRPVFGLLCACVALPGIPRVEVSVAGKVGSVGERLFQTFVVQCLVWAQLATDVDPDGMLI